MAKKVSFKKALAPAAQVPALAPFGAPAAPGFLRRPKWAAKATADVVAVNVWKAMEAERRRTGRQDSRCRAYAADWHLDFTGFHHERRWHPRAEDDLKSEISKQLQRLRQQRATDQPSLRSDNMGPHSEDSACYAAVPYSPSPLPPPIDDTQDADVPLPTMAREQKADRNLFDAPGDDERAPGETARAGCYPPTLRELQSLRDLELIAAEQRIK